MPLRTRKGYSNLLDAALSPFDVAATFASGMIAQPASGFYAAQRKARGLPITREDTQGFADFLTWSPKTQAGQAAFAKLGEGIEAASEYVPEALRGLQGKAGEFGYDVAGPVGGAIGELVPTAIEELVSRGTGRLTRGAGRMGGAPVSEIVGDEGALRRIGRGEDVDRALELHRAGANAQEVSDATGLLVAKTGSGPNDIAVLGALPSSDIDLNYDELFGLSEGGGLGMTLDDLLTHSPGENPSLRALSPRVRQTRMQLSPELARGNASYDPREGLLRLSEEDYTFGDFPALNRAIAHEITHTIGHEGYGMGGTNPEFMARQAGRAITPGLEETVSPQMRATVQAMGDAPLNRVGQALYRGHSGERLAGAAELAQQMDPDELARTSLLDLLLRDEEAMLAKNPLLRNVPDYGWELFRR